MQFPTIHMNGTSVESLLEMNEEAYQALRTAMAALRNAGPNGRDYYPQAGNAMGAAVAEHEARLRRIHEVMIELENMGEYLATEQDKRRTRKVSA